MSRRLRECAAVVTMQWSGLVASIANGTSSVNSGLSLSANRCESHGTDCDLWNFDAWSTSKRTMLGLTQDSIRVSLDVLDGDRRSEASGEWDLALLFKEPFDLLLDSLLSDFEPGDKVFRIMENMFLWGLTSKGREKRPGCWAWTSSRWELVEWSREMCVQVHPSIIYKDSCGYTI